MTDTIYSLFQYIAVKNREKAAVIENNRTMTFGELFDLTDRIAGTFPEQISSIGIVMDLSLIHI